MYDIVRLAMEDHEAQNMLARIDERTLTLVEGFAEFKKEVAQKFVSKDEFTPVRQIVYGLVGLILMSVVGAVVALVVRV